ncbi:MAG: DUF1269 domain-containing protein [Gammaproteobacteria bacterium]
MRRRLYFMLPDVKAAGVVVGELLLARVDESHIHVLAREGTDLGELPEANLLQKSDFVHAVEQGLALGGATGVVAGLGALAIPGIVLGGGAILGIALAGAGVGAWVSGMIGVDVPNSRLAEFEDRINDGGVLMMIDVPKDRVDELSEMVRSHHPEADIRGVEPSIPEFP